MTQHEVVLGGCRPEPLAAYLKALAVFRLVAEQADHDARGWWCRDAFVLRSSLDEAGLVDFLVSRYVPTPVVTPWNGGSGFYPGDAHEAVDAIACSTSPRFAAYRDVIATIRSWPGLPREPRTVRDIVEALQAEMNGLRAGKKRDDLAELIASVEHSRGDAEALVPEIATADLKDVEKLAKQRRGAVDAYWKAAKKARTKAVGLQRAEGKGDRLSAFRSGLPESCLPWLDAALSLRADGSPVFNPVLGSGGNEGRLDFGNNFMQRLVDVVLSPDTEGSARLAGASLFDRLADGMQTASIGQFLPGKAGGFNQGQAIETKDFTINPWDFVLMLEGATTLASASSRTLGAGSRGFAAIPFTVAFSSVGFGSAAETEKARAETWLPLWSRPCTCAEVETLFREGRASMGRRNAESGLDFCRAVATLGVDRGIDEFVRYGFLERRGTNYVALPLARVAVRHRPSVRLLDDLDPILRQLDSFLRKFVTVPASLARARRLVDVRCYAVAEQPDAARFRALVEVLGDIEALLSARDHGKVPALKAPLHGLSPRWILACDDGSVEVRLAAALASIGPTGEVGALRSNLAGVDPRRWWTWAAGNGQKAWAGNSLAERLANVLVRRLLDAERTRSRGVPLQAAHRASMVDAMAFLHGETDDPALERLLFGFQLINWRGDGVSELRSALTPAPGERSISRTWAALALCHATSPVRQQSIVRDQRISARLVGHRVDAALEAALHRLRVSGLHPLPVEADPRLDPLRLAACVMIPVRETRRLEDLVLGSSTTSRR